MADQFLESFVGTSYLMESSNVTFGNESHYTLEDFKRLHPGSILSISVYSVLLVFGLIGNLVVFCTLLKSRYRKSSRVNKLILHLAVADLIVCCFTIPIEIGWRITVTWDAGDLACRVLQFSRPFGLYLSSNTIICISLDRYFAIVQPLKLKDATRRGRIMILLAWIFALISSAPQAVIFAARSGELVDFPGVVVTDCLSTEFFEAYDHVHETIYNVCSICIMYFLPLIVTVGAYARILWAISTTRRLRATCQDGSGEGLSATHGNGTFQEAEKTAMLMPPTGTVADAPSNANALNPTLRFRQQTDLSKIERARSRTLKLTVLIVTVFIVCFTPYAVMVLWYQIDKDSARGLDQTLQESLFLFAVSNSIINPYLYGIYSKSLRNEVGRSRFMHCLRNCLTGPKNSYGGSFSYEPDPDQLRIKKGNVELAAQPRTILHWSRRATRSVDNSAALLLSGTGQRPSQEQVRNPSDHQRRNAPSSSQHSLASDRSHSYHSNSNPTSRGGRRVAAAFKFSSNAAANHAAHSSHGSVYD